MRFSFSLLFLLFITSFQSTFGTSYYISNNGDDNNDGLSAATPFKTLQHLSTIFFQQGDSIFFESGQEFMGTLQVSTSTGTIKALYIGTYNGTARAILSGGVKVTDWTQNSAIATAIIAQPVSAVFVSGQRQTPARYPDNGYLTLASVNGTAGFYSSSLSQDSGYWDGAQVHIRSKPNQYETATIGQFNNGNIIYTSPFGTTPQNGNGFYIDQSYQALTINKEWYYHTANNTLHFIPENASDLQSGAITAITTDYGIWFTAPCDSIIIENLEFKFYNKSAVYFSAAVTNSVIRHNKFLFGNDAAIKSTGVATLVTIYDNIISDFLSNGISFYQTWHSLIYQNTITDIGLVAGQGSNGLSQYIPIHTVFAAYSEFLDNTFIRFGNCAIKADGPYNSFKRNYIRDGLLTLTSSGGLNFYGEVCKYLQIEDNFILNIKGNQDGLAQYDELNCGILMNAFCHNNNIVHNTIANGGNYGIWITTDNYEHKISDNLIYNSLRAQLTLNDFYGTPGSNQNHKIVHNIFYSLSNMQACLQYETINSSNHYSSTDSNYYCNPYNYVAVREKFVNIDPVMKEYPLPVWKHLSLADTNSIATRVTLNQYQINTESSEELIMNGTFTNNFDNWGLLSDVGVEMLLDNDIGMDGGCIKVVVQDTSLAFAQLQSKDFALQLNQYYRLRYSVFGNHNSYMNTSTYKDEDDYHSVGLDRYVPYETTRTEKEFIFKSSEECPFCAARFAMFKGDSMLVMDNITLKHVTVFPLDSTKSNRLITNYSNQSIDVNLHDTLFIDLNGSIVSGQYTLPPYSSYVLIPRHIIYNDIEPVIPTQKNEIALFPNPVKDILFVQLSENIQGATTIEILSLNGQVLYTLHTTNHFFNLPVQHLQSGVYLLKVTTGQSVYTTKWIQM